jgi:hypothetical protein
MEQQLQAIALERKKALKATEDAKAFEADAKPLRSFRENLKKGDHIAALEALDLKGDALDEFYNKLTDQIVARGKQAQDPVELAKKLARAEIEAWQESQRKDAEAKVADGFVATAARMLSESRGKFPGAELALLRGDIDRNDLYSVAEALKTSGKPHDVEATLAFISGHFSQGAGTPAGGSTTAESTSAAGAAGGPAGATTQAGAPPEAKKTPVTAAPPATLSSNVPVVADEDDDNLTIEQRLERAKAKARKRAGQ